MGSETRAAGLWAFGKSSCLQFSRMRDVTSGEGTHLRCQECGHRNGFTREGHEFDLVARSTLMDVHHRPDVARLQTLFGQVLR